MNIKNVEELRSYAELITQTYSIGTSSPFILKTIKQLIDECWKVRKLLKGVDNFVDIKDQIVQQIIQLEEIQQKSSDLIDRFFYGISSDLSHTEVKKQAETSSGCSENSEEHSSKNLKTPLAFNPPDPSSNVMILDSDSAAQKKNNSTTDVKSKRKIIKNESENKYRENQVSAPLITFPSKVIPKNKSKLQEHDELRTKHVLTSKVDPPSFKRVKLSDRYTITASVAIPPELQDDSEIMEYLKSIGMDSFHGK